MCDNVFLIRHVNNITKKKGGETMSYKSVEKQKAFQRKWLHERRETLLAHECCALCGSNKKLVAHHIIPRKISGQPKIGWSWKIERIIRELQHCMILCERCHIELHASLIRKKLEHGTYAGYKRGCRCDQCKSAYFDFWKLLLLQRSNSAILSIEDWMIEEFKTAA